ncbi:MAG: hypothetical protein V3W18_06460 [candidate division Zixibacteria bacterium]
MELYLQFGYGMMEHSRHLIRNWGTGHVILSPRDLTREQMQRLGQEIIDVGGNILVDPQLYDPNSNHHRLRDHEYWPSNFNIDMLTGGPGLSELIRSLENLNTDSHATKFIIPGIYATRVDDDWLAIQDSIISESKAIVKDMPLLATVCLSSESIRFEEQIETIVNAAENWDVSGLYIVPEHPRTSYLVDDPMWLSNLMLLCSGIKLQRKTVIIGYANHQMLCLSAAKVDAISAGTWLNVRSFSTAKFQETDEEDISRRAKWYYSPSVLSEFKIPFLDIANSRGLLDSLKPDSSMESNYASILFSGAQPTTTSYSEQQSHRHYLQCLHQQCISSVKLSFDETVNANIEILNHAENLISELHRRGVRGQDRDFFNIIDVNRAALISLNEARGFILKRIW